MIWFTADLHLGHRNIIRFCDRWSLCGLDPAEAASHDKDRKPTTEDVARHDEQVLANINDCVGENDTLWILGDFSLSPARIAREYREQIHCRNVGLVRGNHDLKSYDEFFDPVIDQGIVRYQGRRMFLNHYPMRSWDGAFHGAWHLYGHVHNRLAAEDAAEPNLLVKDVGLDACNYRPISFTELLAYMEPREAAFRERYKSE